MGLIIEWECPFILLLGSRGYEGWLITIWSTCPYLQPHNSEPVYSLYVFNLIMPIYTTNVYVPYIELYLQIETDEDTTLKELGETIQKATANDNQLRIFRYAVHTLNKIQIQWKSIRNEHPTKAYWEWVFIGWFKAVFKGIGRNDRSLIGICY